MTLDKSTALLLIDIQQGFEDIEYWGGARNNEDAEEKAAKLLRAFRAKALPIFHAKHNSTNPISPLVKGKKGNEIHELVLPRPGEIVYEKNVNSAFIGTQLEQDLKDNGIKKVLIAGLTTDHCISTSTRMAANLGFEVILVEDACATFDKVGSNGKKFPAALMHEVEIAALKSEFADIFTTEQILEYL
ncbi:MAG: cysteine hydrolase [Bacteroidia bacterium]|nr:cysteine hydrolase [Bacteroidia bacterium]